MHFEYHIILFFGHCYAITDAGDIQRRTVFVREDVVMM